MKKVAEYLSNSRVEPLFLTGDALEILQEMPGWSIDCVMTSPPYWQKREYANGGIGMEASYEEYIEKLLEVFANIYSVLKPAGSFWLNIGDSYLNKTLLGLPWRIALEMMKRQSWMLRNEIIWHKRRGGIDNTNDKLGNVHEQVFHFVKNPQYYYDADAIRNKPGRSKVVNGSVVTATGVSGVNYKRQIKNTRYLTPVQKRHAYKALNETLKEVKLKKIADFRMTIKGKQRVVHSNSKVVSGRARELQKNGFYFVKYHPKGSKPRDVWRIMPEDSQNTDDHFAVYPEELCRIPILATCPKEGVVLDPFCGMGTSNVVAYKYGKKSIGIDIASEYVGMARWRCKNHKNIKT